jgi:YVTN family beta-propeller protein
MRWTFLTIVATCVAPLLAGPNPPARADAAARHTAPAWRRPVAVAVTGDRVFAANRGGSVSVVDVAAGRVDAEADVGRTLSDLVAAPDGRSLYATDQAGGELLRLEWDGRALRVTGRVQVAAYPVTVRLARDGASCSVASLWSHQLTVVDLAGPMRARYTVDLPFAARQQWPTPDGTGVVVADAFGGGLAVVDLASSAVLSHRSIHAHNVRGLAATPDGGELLLAHQMLDANTPTEASRVTWGQVVGNVLRAVRVDELLRATAAGADEDAVPIGRWSMYPLGGNGAGAGDPGAVAVGRGGVTAVALSGVNAVALRDSALDAFRRVAVGRRPTALAFSGDGSRLYVANTSDDSISVVDVAGGRVTATIPLGPPPPLTEAQRGEQLFYDARLALDGWYSCHSCHPDGHTNGLSNDNLSDGTFGTPKRVLSLLGVETTQPWAWRGGRDNLEEQTQSSILSTMRGPHAGAMPANVNAIAAFLRTLTPPPGVDAARGVIDPEAVARGRTVFAENRCGRCHSPPDFTSQDTYDVGLSDEGGLRRYNPPSLLGVSQRGRYLHDGRARNLREVFEAHRHPDDEPPGAEDLPDLIAFLRSL